MITYKDNTSENFASIPEQDLYEAEEREGYSGEWHWTKPSFSVNFPKPTKEFVLEFISNSTSGSLAICTEGAEESTISCNYKLEFNSIPLALREPVNSIHVSVAPIVQIPEESRTLGICLNSIHSPEKTWGDKLELMHLHIPKCAGTSIDNYFLNVFDRKQCLINSMGFLSTIGLREASDRQFLSYNYVSGHFTSSLPLRINKLDRTFTVLRNPVDRAISDYNEARNSPFITAASIINHKFSLEELLLPENLPLAQSVGLSNRMTSLIIGGFPSYALQEHGISQTHAINIAKSILKGMLAVGFIDNIPELLSQIAEKTGIRSSTPFGSRDNAGRYDRKEYNRIENLIQDANQLDCEIYEWARKEFC